MPKDERANVDTEINSEMAMVSWSTVKNSQYLFHFNYALFQLKECEQIMDLTKNIVFVKWDMGVFVQNLKVFGSIYS